MKHFYLRVIQEDIPDFESQQRDELKNDKGMPVTRNESLTDERHQPGTSVAGIKPLENTLALSFWDELRIFNGEENIDEFVQADQRISSSVFFSPLEEICPSVQTIISNTYGSGLMHPLILTQGPRAHRERPYLSDECGQTFQCSSKLRRHPLIHPGEKLCMCDICGKVFSQNSKLTRHQRIHTGEKPYKCNECGKVFNQKATLVGHQSVHTGEKPYKCIECGKDFSHKGNLASHQRLHTGEKPYKCNQCGKVFSHKGNLASHQKIHSGERPYKCNECGKVFTHKTTLASHWRVHTGEKPYQCSECGKVFSHKGNLASHERIIQERDLTNVMNVAKPFIRPHISQNINRSMQEQKYISAMYVGKYSFEVQTLQFIREFILERDLNDLIAWPPRFGWRVFRGSPSTLGDQGIKNVSSVT
nr:LOW QUALITY PROTEIN: zinc finger protein 83-like [Vicugna pacos]